MICFDKTGTLTLNQMTVRAVYFRGRRFGVSGEGYAGAGAITPLDGAPAPDFASLLLPAALANGTRIRDGDLIGDPTEGALLALAAKGGVEQEAAAERLPRIGEIPFDSEHKFMAAFHHDGEWVRLYLKGAPDVLLARSARFLGVEGEAARVVFGAENETLAGQALRVLAVTTRAIPAAHFAPDADPMTYAHDLTFVGLAGIIDPPRPEARYAIALCRRAGIQVKMITGDHKVTAAAIARALGLDGEVLEGRELDALPPETLAEHIERAAVFARCRRCRRWSYIGVRRRRSSTPRHSRRQTGEWHSPPRQACCYSTRRANCYRAWSIERENQEIQKTMQRDVERNYPRKDFITKLRRLADALEHGVPFRIQVAGKRIAIPGDAAIGVEHERGGGAEKIEFQLKWRTARCPKKA